MKALRRERCPGCGLVLAESDGPTHAYIGASASCWAKFGLVLAREFGDPAYFGVHQITVDAYAVQHPGEPGRRSVQSVGLHLMTLALVVEEGADPADGPALHRRMIGRPKFEWLDPPDLTGRLTVLDVLDASSTAAHASQVRAWGADVWDAWSPHHTTVRTWVAESFGDRG